MAVLQVQLFALTGAETALTDDEMFTAYAHLTGALITLTTPNTLTDDVVVISHDVHPYDTGAVIYVVGYADHAETVTDVVAAQLETAMTNNPTLFKGWRLMAGDSTVWCSDN